MPLNANSISQEIKPIWKQWAFTAFKNMHVIPFSEDLPITQMQLLTAQGFGVLFSGIAPQLTTAINNGLMQGIVSTSNGSSPPKPLTIPSVTQGMQTVFQKWATKAFLEMHTASFSEDIDQDQMQELTANKFGEVFSNGATDFATELVNGLTASGFISLVPTAIASDFKPIFKKWAKKAFRDMHGSSFSENLPITDMQLRTAQKFSEVFSNIAPEFGVKLVKTFKSSPVTVPLGVGSIT